MELVYGLTPRDLVVLDLYLYRKNLLRPNTAIPFIIVLLVVLLMTGNNLYLVSQGQDFGFWVGKPFGFLLLVFAIIAVEIVLRRMNCPRTDPKLLMERTLALGPDGIQINVDGSITALRWFAIPKIESLASRLFIPLASNAAIIIPHRAIGSPQDVAAFVAHYQDLRKRNISAGLDSAGRAAGLEHPEGLQIVYTLRPEDTAAAAKLAAKKDAVNPWVLTCVFSVIGFAAAGGLVFFLYDAWKYDLKLFRGSLLVLGAVILFFGAVVGVMQGVQSLARARRAKAPVTSAGELLARSSISLKDDGVMLSTGGGEIFFPWVTVHSVTEDAERLYIAATPRYFMPIPRRAFTSPEDMQAFLRLARKRWLLATGSLDADNPW